MKGRSIAGRCRQAPPDLRNSPRFRCVITAPDSSATRCASSKRTGRGTALPRGAASLRASGSDEKPFAGPGLCFVQRKERLYSKISSGLGSRYPWSRVGQRLQKGDKIGFLLRGQAEVADLPGRAVGFRKVVGEATSGGAQRGRRRGCRDCCGTRRSGRSCRQARRWRIRSPTSDRWRNADSSMKHAPRSQAMTG